MKKNLFLITIFLFSTQLLFAQKDYKVVFDLTSKDSLDQRSLVRWAGEVANAGAQVEVVMYGQGVHLVKDKLQKRNNIFETW